MRKLLGLVGLLFFGTSVGSCDIRKLEELLGSRVNLFLKDAPPDSLDEFTLAISKIVFHSQGGGEVTVFSGGPISVNVADLVMVQELLASVTVPAGAYTGISLEVMGITASANGVPQTVQGISLPAAFQVTFQGPVDFGPQADVTLDLDLGDSVADGGGNTIVVTPVLFAEVDGEVQNEIKLRGIVLEVTGSGFTLQVNGTAVSVGVSSQTEFELDGGLEAGMSVKVKGHAQGSLIIAEEVEGEDPEIEMVVTGMSGTLVTGVVLEAEGSLSSSFAPGDAATVEAANASFHSELGEGAVISDLELGQKLEVEGTLVNGTIVASKVKLQKTRFFGTVSSVDGSAGTVTLSPIKAEGKTIAGLSSRVFSVTGNTEFSVGGAFPADASGVLPGQVVRIRAARDVSTDQWVLLRVDLKPEDLEGTIANLANVTSAGLTFDPGGLETPAVVSFVSDPKIVLVQGGVSSQISLLTFLALVPTLPSAAAVSVEVSGSSVTEVVVMIP